MIRERYGDFGKQETTFLCVFYAMHKQMILIFYNITQGTSQLG